MKIGILGVGNIGRTLARTLATAGHEVRVANSRGPGSIEPDVLATGARAVDAKDVVHDVDVLILSIPLHRLPSVAALVSELPEGSVVIDTSNYYPGRDSRIEAGQVESLWVAQQLGRTVVKAWNAIGSDSFATRGQPRGRPGRIAIPVAGDDVAARELAMQLVDATGFDAFDAGPLAASWRQQPGAPCYCTDLTLEEMPAAHAGAVAERLPKRRDLAVAAIMERLGDGTTNPNAEFAVRLNRVLYM